MIEIRHDRIDTDQALQLAYDTLYSDRSINHLESLYLWLIGLMKPQKGQMLLDISCGEGRLVQLANQLDITAYGFDLSISGLRKSRIKDTKGAFFLANGEEIPISQKTFDLITHIGSLEHYINPQAGAQELCRVLKPGGKACILLPNTFGFWGNIIHVSRTGDVHDDGQPLQRYGTRKAWTAILENAGLDVIEIHGYAGSGLVFPHTWQDLWWLLSKPQKILKFILNFFVPLNLTNHLVFICTPRLETNL